MLFISTVCHEMYVSFNLTMTLRKKGKKKKKFKKKTCEDIEDPMHVNNHETRQQVFDRGKPRLDRSRQGVIAVSRIAFCITQKTTALRFPINKQLNFNLFINFIMSITQSVRKPLHNKYK